jgi:hypothetical protein
MLSGTSYVPRRSVTLLPALPLPMSAYTVTKFRMQFGSFSHKLCCGGGDGCIVLQML